MQKIFSLLLLAFLFAWPSVAQMNSNPYWYTVGKGLNANKPATCRTQKDVYVCTDCSGTGAILYCNIRGTTPNTWNAVGTTDPGTVSWFPVVTRSTDAPANAFNLGGLTSGLLKISVAGGVATPSIATAGDIPDLSATYNTGSGSCPGGQYVSSVNKNSAPTCGTPATQGSQSDFTTVAYSATPTFTAASATGTTFKITLTGNVSSSTLSGASAGQILTWYICQDSTGGRTFVWPTSVLNAGTIDSTADACSSQTFIWDGTYAQVIGIMSVSGASPGLNIPGSTSGTVNLVAQAIASGTVTLPNGTTTLGDASTNTATSVDGEMALFNGTGGKTLKRSSLTGVLKASSGVASVVTGTASDCVKVDGSSGSCGEGAPGGGTDLTDLTQKVVRDTFCEGRSQGSTNDYGAMKWVVTGSNTSPTTSFERLCGLTITTGSGASPSEDNAVLAIGGSPIQIVVGTDANWAATWKFKLPADLTSYELYLGFTPSSLPGMNCLSDSRNCMTLVFDSAAPTKFSFRSCDNAWNCTTTDSTVSPVAGDTYTVTFTAGSDGSITAKLNSETPIAVSSNLPTGTLVPGIDIAHKGAAVSRSLTVRDFLWISTGL